MLVQWEKILEISYFPRLDYQPLFGKMSPHSSSSLRGGSKTGPGRRRKSSLYFPRWDSWTVERRTIQRGGFQYTAGLYSGSAWWPVAPNFCSWATRKSYFFHTNHMLGASDFTSSEHWASFSFSWSTALTRGWIILAPYVSWIQSICSKRVLLVPSAKIFLAER